MEKCLPPGQTYGTGMNSLRVRFSLMVLVLGALSAGALIYAAQYFTGSPFGPAFWPVVFVAGVMVGVSVLGIYAASGMLASQIRALSESAEKIAAGELDTSVDVECQCDVGGLANSMRQMLVTMRSNLEHTTHLAHFDQVTGLPNRLHLSECLSRRVAMSKTDPGCIGSILYMDLNGFKRVNDTFGHGAGDKLLRAVSERILTVSHMASVENNKVTAMDPELGCRNPVLARFGGDEFILHIPGKVLSRELARECGKIIRALEQPFDIDGRLVTVGTSIGVSSYPADADEGEALVRNADLAMYVAKQDARDHYSFFESSLLSDAVEHRALEQDLKTAIGAGELEVYYQPKIDVSSMELSGAEALVRWNHPTRGLLGPGNFIDIAESTGMIVDLGDFVLQQSIRQCAAFARQGKQIKVAINVSLAQLERDNFARRVAELIEQERAPAASIILEITESIASMNLKRIQLQMRPLRVMGVRFSIDDFGTGYSNLAKLLNLRFDELKIDRSLVTNINFNPQHRAAVRMIVGLAHNMGCQVLAEGIETSEQFDMIRELGCGEVQGFLFAKPMPIGELQKWEGQWVRSNAARGSLSPALEEAGAA